MRAQHDVLNTVDPDWKWLHRAGGISAFILGVGYVCIIALYVPVGVPPKAVEAHLAYLARNSTAWWGIVGLSVFTDFLFIPVALSLYLTLKRINRGAMLLATACVTLFVVLDLAITWTNYALLITLARNHAAATSEVQRAVFVTAANYPSALLQSPLLPVYIILVPAIGFLVTGLVMLKGIFSKPTAYMAVISGILGIVSVVGPMIGPGFLGLSIVVASALTAVWLLFVGHRLCKLSQP